MLEIRDLVKLYPGGVSALCGVSLDIPHGMFGLLGPNGSGKTTLMRILAGLLEPSAGSILKDGVDVTRRPELIWPRLGYLPQDFGFYPDLTGTAMLEHLLVLKGVDAPGGLVTLCAALLDRVNLTAAADRKIRTYSGGMRQRLGIAQAIAGDPDLVIVDEPTAGLDPEERNRFYRLLADLARDRTVILSTHIVEDVATLCPEFAVIRHGRLVAQTTPRAARLALRGTIFEGVVDNDELERLSQEGRLTQAHLVEGRNLARVHSPDGRAPAGFDPAVATLEDAYFVMTRPSQTARPAA
jgi:ABC-type multidrug transport system ATPase subunit